jgi:ABC-type transport system substrate-binding protein
MRRVVGLALICVASVGSDTAGAALPPAYAGELNLPSPVPLRVPDPIAADDPFEAAMAAAVFDTLYVLSPAGRPRPALAAAMPERTGSHARIKLRPGLRRHDGRLLQAAHVVASLERASRSPRGYLLASFERRGGTIDARAEDDTTLSVRLARPDAPVARVLSATTLAVVIARGVGTGSFRARVSPGEISLEAFRHAPEGAPYLNRIRIAAPAGRQAELRAFELGQLDASWYGASLYGGSPARAVASASPAPAVPVLLVPNRARGPLRAADAWGAVARAIDRTRLARAGLRPSSRLAASLPEPAVPEGRRGTARMTLRMPVPDGDLLRARLAEALAGVLDEAGVALVVEPLDRERYDDAIARGSYDLRLASVLPPLPGRVALVAEALAVAGQEPLARELVRDTGLRDEAPAATAAARLDAIVLGHRQGTLHHRADLRGLRFERGRLDLRRIHLARPPETPPP